MLIALHKHMRESSVLLFLIKKNTKLHLAHVAWILALYRRITFAGSSANPVRTLTAILLGSEYSVVLFGSMLFVALSEVCKVYPELHMESFVGDMNLVITVVSTRTSKPIVWSQHLFTLWYNESSGPLFGCALFSSRGLSSFTFYHRL